MATIAIVGMGGLGCPAALALAEAGGARLVLIDDDRVERSNLQRQVLYTAEDIGRPKLEAAAERLAVIAPGCAVTTRTGRVDAATADALLGGADLVLDGTDDPVARFVINDWALAHGVPAVLGGILRFDGLVLAVGPGYGPCFRCLFEAPPTPEEAPSCATAGVVGALAGLVGHLQAERALGILAGDVARHTGFVTTIDALRGRIRHVPLPEATGCAVCGGVARRLDITAHTCPFTYVHTKLALDEVPPGGIVDILMRRGEPARNVPRSLREDGHAVLCAGEIGADRYRVMVRRAA